MFTLLLILIFLVCYAMLFGQGLWNNALTLINVVLSGLLAMTMFEPVARLLESFEPTFTYVWDYVAIWAVFCVSFIVLCGLTAFLSGTQVRFKHLVNLIGSNVLAIWISYLMVGFTLATLHTAPLGQHFMRGAFQQKPESRMFFGLAPDQQWLGFVQKVSGGSFSTSAPEGEGEKGMNVFDPRGEYILRYSARRAKFEKNETIRVYRGKPEQNAAP